MPQQFYGLALPNNLNSLVKALGLISNQTVESLTLNHTLYLFYKNFLTQAEASLLRSLMKKKTGRPIFQVVKIAAFGESENKRSLNFCHQCFENDLRGCGEAYWHRMHQVPGIFVCLTHRAILKESLVPFHEGYLDCHAANSENCPVSTHEAGYKEDTVQRLLEIAQDIDWLISSNFEFKGLQWLRKRYQHYLIEQGFMSISSSKTFKFDGRKFADVILDFYSQEFWDIVKPGLYTHAEQYFAHCLLACDIMPTIDRVTHIALIRFLSSSLKDFFKE